jgi:hypothetical protein
MSSIFHALYFLSALNLCRARLHAHQMTPFMRRNALALILNSVLLLVHPAGAEEPDDAVWPAITQTSKPWTRWWWPASAVNEKDLTKQLSMFAEAGLGGVEVTPIYGARGAENRYIDFLSPHWMSMLEYSSREAKRHGLGVDMATGTGWPFGGPRVDQPDGSYSIALEGERLKGTPTGMKVKRAAPGGEGLVLDPYSTSALQNYLEPFSRAFAQFPRDQVRGQFHDSFEYYDASWTSKLPDVFLRMHGYDIQNHAAQLLGEKPTDTDTSTRIKSDYRQTIASMHLDYLRTWVEWSHAHGFVARNQSHGAPANLLDLYGAVDIPETESFGSAAYPIAGMRRDPRDVRADHSPPHPLMFRMASSAAHVMGHPLTSSETGTWLREHWKETPSALKPQIDQLFTAGINHIFYHGTVYTPQDAPWPGWYFYASTQLSVTNPLWNDFAELNAYVARVQSVLQSGRPDNEVLLYWPFNDLLDRPDGLVHQYTVEHAQWLLDSAAGRLAMRLDAAGYSFDFISDDQILQTRFEHGGLATSGNRYRVIVIPTTRRMPAETLAHLSGLIDQGAVVLFEALPEDVPGYGRLEERRAQFRSLIKSPRLAEVVVGAAVERALAARNIAREAAVDAGLSYIRRAQPKGHDYFLVNQSATRFEGWIELGTNARQAMLLDPITGRAGTAALRSGDDGHTRLYLQLDSGQSVLVRTRSGRSALSTVEPWRYTQPDGEPTPLNGEWTINFIDGGPSLPRPHTVTTLQSWTEFGGEATQRFAGTARYRIEFDSPKKQADEWMLDLGEVREAARVRLNGAELAGGWSLPFQVNLGALAPGRNVLEIDVTNVAANRIRDMDRRHQRWRIMKEIDIVNIHYQPFNASQWEIAPSGLLGPVSLIPLKRMRP